MEIQEYGTSVGITLKLAGCMIHFKHRLSTTKEVNAIKHYFLI
jgi:hypothetical protein